MTSETEEEIRYLNNIGTYCKVSSESLRNPREHRRQLLKGYLESAERKAVWGEIDKEKVIEHAKILLEELERPTHFSL